MIQLWNQCFHECIPLFLLIRNVKSVSKNQEKGHDSHYELNRSLVSGGVNSLVGGGILIAAGDLQMVP